MAVHYALRIPQEGGGEVDNLQTLNEQSVNDCAAYCKVMYSDEA